MAIDRRRFTAACLAAAGLLPLARLAAAQTALDQTPTDPVALNLLANLVTRMSIPVTIDRQGPFRFVIDTGAGRTAVSDALAEALNLPQARDVMVHGVTSAERTAAVRVGRLGFAREAFRNLTMPVFPRARLGADGLLGLDVLGQFQLVFDTGRSSISISRSSRSVATGGAAFVTGSRIRDGNAIKARRRMGQLTVIDVVADGVRVEAFVDTGAQYSIGNLALYDSIATRRPGLRDRHWAVPVLGVTGGALNGRLAVLDDLRVGGAVLPRLPVVFAPLHAFRIMGLEDRPALLMGADLIGRFNQVTLDFGHDEMRFGTPRRLRRA